MTRLSKEPRSRRHLNLFLEFLGIFTSASTTGASCTVFVFLLLFLFQKEGQEGLGVEAVN